MTEQLVIVDEPIPLVRRLTLNRPGKRNALSNELRGQLFDAMRAADLDPDVRVMIIRGAGTCFSSGYDLKQAMADNRQNLPRHASNIDGYWARHLVEGWFEVWDYTTPVIAQVHGWCLAGGSELAAACDLVYVAEDAQIGYPPVRLMGTPDMAWQPWLMGMRRAAEALFTGDAMSGLEAVQAGVANRAFPAEELDEGVLSMAARIAKVDRDLLALNKRVLHRSMEVMGIRTALRANTEAQALSRVAPGPLRHREELRENVRAALANRDAQFGDYTGATAG